MIYKDSKGEEWELVNPDSDRYLRRVKKPKQTWDVHAWVFAVSAVFSNKLSPKEREAIKAFIEAGLKTIYDIDREIDELLTLLGEAREAIGDKDGS